MESTENAEEVKSALRLLLEAATSNDFYYGIFLLVVMAILLYIIDLAALPFRKRGKENITLNLVKLIAKAFVVIVIGMRVFLMIPGMDTFTSQILMSSSLIVVVLGFVFQEGLSNIVHGIILSLFHPFDLGDRVTVTIDGVQIIGYIRSMDLRHTVIQNALNSAHVVVPNSKMDLCVIENNYFEEKKFSSSFMDISVTYECNLEKALQVLEAAILDNPMVQQTRTAHNITGSLNPMVLNLADSGILLRASVTTMTIEENYTACSNIRRDLVARFKEDPELDFAYPHMHLVQDELSERVARKTSGQGSVAD